MPWKLVKLGLGVVCIDPFVVFPRASDSPSGTTSLRRRATSCQRSSLVCARRRHRGRLAAMHAAGVERIPPPAVPGESRGLPDYKPFLEGTCRRHSELHLRAGGDAYWRRLAVHRAAGRRCSTTASNRSRTHFQSRNPQRNNAIQATWQHSRDTSAVWATRRDGSLDANYVAPGAIEWLLLDVSGAQLGPTAGDKLSTAFVHPTRQHPGRREATVHGVHAGNAEHAQAGALRGRLLLLQIRRLSPSVRQTDSSVTASHAAGTTNGVRRLRQRSHARRLRAST